MYKVALNGGGDRMDSDMRAARLIDNYSSMVYRLALSYTSNRADAEDIMQEVFLRYIKKGIAFESDEHEKAWFIRVTVNCCKSMLSSSWRKRVINTADFERYGKSSRTDNSDNGEVLDAVMSLPAAQRLCIHLFYYEELSVLEIARATGQKESTVKSHLFRARAALKSILKGEICNVQG